MQNAYDDIDPAVLEYLRKQQGQQPAADQQGPGVRLPDATQAPAMQHNFTAQQPIQGQAPAASSGLDKGLDPGILGYLKNMQMQRSRVTGINNPWAPVQMQSSDHTPSDQNIDPNGLKLNAPGQTGYQDNQRFDNFKNNQLQRNVDMLANTNKSFAQLGTLQGKVQDTSPPYDMAKSIGQGLDQQRSDEQGIYSRNQDQTKLSDSVMRYLQDRLDKNKATSDKNQSDLDIYNRKRTDIATDRDANFANDKALKAMSGSASGDNPAFNLKLDHDLRDFNEKMISEKQKGNSPYAKAGQSAYAASRMQALAEKSQLPGQHLNPEEMQELAGAAASLLTNGSQATVHAMQVLVPPMAVTDIPGYIIQRLTGKQQDANRQEFANNLMNTADREKIVALDVIKSAQDQTAGGHTFFNNYPRTAAEYNKIVNDRRTRNDTDRATSQARIDAYNKKHAEQATMQNKGQAPQNMGAPNAITPIAPGHVEDGMRYKGGPADDPNSWEAQ